MELERLLKALMGPFRLLVMRIWVALPRIGSLRVPTTVTTMPGLSVAGSELSSMVTVAPVVENSTPFTVMVLLLTLVMTPLLTGSTVEAAAGGFELLLPPHPASEKVSPHAAINQ
ncbi:hypothetical protein GMLC_09560 [Geomonas limicola]|uniref:Uncharacterized protein n=1 Tax=Geomonas limicola TaxID=2740186 RepID=A0A6V8N6D2_9BACT|nr:hypothetical protein GMLC_09560 [Geomonas limicola]